MITDYIKENDRIIAIDNKEGIKEYDYQDNIEDILKQKNIIEELIDTINKLVKEKEFIKTNKKSFLNMLRTENYGDKVLALFLVSAIFLIMLQIFFVEYPLISSISTNIGRLLFFSVFPYSIFKFQNYKKEMDLKFSNIKEQIRCFSLMLDKEQIKLHDLEKEKKKDDIDKKRNVSIHIDNKTNDKVIEIEKKKLLYQTYRKYCVRILKSKNKNKLSTLFDNTYNEQDIESIKEMSDRASNALFKANNEEKTKKYMP